MRRIKYRGKTVALTGASSGIGYSLAKRLIKKYDCLVIGIARGLERLDLVKNELGGQFIPYQMDVSKKEEWDALYTYLEKENKKIDILINCAGVLPKFKAVEKTEISEVESVLNINLMSEIYSFKSLGSLINKGGAIINISSIAALCPFGGVSTYSVSKSSALAFSQALGAELKDISVSVALPGFVKTDIMKNQGASEKDFKLYKRFSASPDKTARKILFRAGFRKSRIIVGTDAHLLKALYTLFPNRAPKIVTRLLRKSGLELFSQI